MTEQTPDAAGAAPFLETAEAADRSTPECYEHEATVIDRDGRTWLYSVWGDIWTARPLRDDKFRSDRYDTSLPRSYQRLVAEFGPLEDGNLP